VSVLKTKRKYGAKISWYNFYAVFYEESARGSAKKRLSLLTNQPLTHGTMNFPLVNHYARCNGDMWPAHPMQGVRVYHVQGGFLVPIPASRRCSPAPGVIDLVNAPAEVIDLMDEDSSTGTAVIDLMDDDSPLPAEVIDLMDDDSSTGTAVIDLIDDDSSLETVHPPTVDGEDWSLGSMSKVSDDDFKGMDDWETLTDTFVSEPSTSVIVQHGDNASRFVTGREGLIWDGGSLSFLDGLKDSAMPTDFGDDDISAIAEQAETQPTTAVVSREVCIDSESLFGRTFEEHEVPMDVSDDDDDDDDDDDSVVFLKVSHPTNIVPASVDDQNRNVSRSYLDRPTRMVSLDDETPCNVVQSENEACAVVAAPEEEFDLDASLLSFEFNAGLVVPWDTSNRKQSATLQGANVPTTSDHDFPMATLKW
jgi:hypothetical protein